MKRQNSASFVSRSFFLSSDFSVSRLFPLPDAFLRMAGSGKVFGLNTPRRRKILPETALPPDLVAAIRAMRYLCIRASGTSGWRNEPQLYHRLPPLPQETKNVIGVSLLMLLTSFITNRLNEILSLLHILNAMATIISRL